MHRCVQISTYIYKLVYVDNIWIYAQLNIYMCVCMHVCVCEYIYIYIYIYTDIHRCIFIYMHKGWMKIGWPRYFHGMYPSEVDFFNIVPFADHTLLPLVFQFLDPILEKLINRKYDIITWTFQPTFIYILCIWSHWYIYARTHGTVDKVFGWKVLLHEINWKLQVQSQLLVRITRNISLSSCRTASTDVPDLLSPPISIVHRSQEIFQTTSCIGTELVVLPLLVPVRGSTGVYHLWVHPFWSSMSGLSNLDSFCDGR